MARRRIVITLLQSILKCVNSIMGMTGIAMIIYGIWMARVWQTEMEKSSFEDLDSYAAWFIYTCICIGIVFCVTTCLGHIGADSGNEFCLFCYRVLVSIIILSESAISADVLLNSDWKKDLPEDPTGRFRDLKQFVNSNVDFCQWICLLIIFVQGLSILLAMALRATLSNQCCDYDNDENHEFTARLPLVSHYNPLWYAKPHPTSQTMLPIPGSNIKWDMNPVKLDSAAEIVR